jgi:hypothetical protein
MYRSLTQLTSTLMIGLGAAMLIVTALEGGGTAGFVLGALFVAAGAARLRLLRRRRG